jgi:glycosyltransferase involved in cell wall biosynthesis
MASVAGEAALHFDPEDTGAIVDAMIRLTSDGALRAQLSAAGPARASEFSWEAAARATLAALAR